MTYLAQKHISRNLDMITKITERDSEFYNTFQSKQNIPQANKELNGYSSLVRAPGPDAAGATGSVIGANRR